MNDIIILAAVIWVGVAIYLARSDLVAAGAAYTYKDLALAAVKKLSWPLTIWMSSSPTPPTSNP